MSDNRFPRSARLLQAPDFKRVFARPERSSDAYFSVLAIDTGERAARLGLAVSKKQAKRAVDRNRLKRLIREIFRRHKHEMVGIDFVVMIRSAALVKDNRRLGESLARHMDRLLGKIHPFEESKKTDH